MQRSVYLSHRLTSTLNELESALNVKPAVLERLRSDFVATGLSLCGRINLQNGMNVAAHRGRLRPYPARNHLEVEPVPHDPVAAPTYYLGIIS